MLRDAFNLNTVGLAGGLDKANEQLARARAQAGIRSAMQSPDGTRDQIATTVGDPASAVSQVRHSVLSDSISAGLRPFIIAIACLLSLASAAVAQCPRCGQFHPPYDRQPAQTQTPYRVQAGELGFTRPATIYPSPVGASHDLVVDDNGILFHRPKSGAQPVRNVVGGVARVAADVVFGANDALAEVNAARARCGLRPFLPDPLLAQGAQACAQTRAARRIADHLPNDFRYLPPGSRARHSGCAAWEPSMGWGACCTYENWTYAGAAWAMGSDGRRYMHLFVR